jgi:hypothetical protein
MVEFSVRIDFYRDLEAPKDYVGSTLRDGLSAVVLPPGSASTCLASAPTPGAKAPTATPTALFTPSSTAPRRSLGVSHSIWPTGIVPLALAPDSVPGVNG